MKASAIDPKSVPGFVLPAGYSARPPTVDDAEAVIDMLNAYSREHYGGAFYRVDECRAAWSNPESNVAATKLVVCGTENRPVGYETVSAISPYVQWRLLGCVHPDHCGLGVGTALLRWAEARARSLLSQATPDLRVDMLVTVGQRDRLGRRLLEDNGFGSARLNLSMAILLDQPISPSPLPSGIAVRPFVVGRDERGAYDTWRESVSDIYGLTPPDSDHQADFERFCREFAGDDFDPSLHLVACEGDEVVGLSFSHWEGDPDLNEGVVDWLGVRRRWRRRGIARALMLHTFCEFHRRGRRKVALGVDAESLTGADKLYRRLGMHDDDRGYVTYLKTIREGRDIARRALDNE